MLTVQGCRPLTEEVYSVEKVVEKGVVLELATTSRKYPKTFRPMEALGQDLATHVSPEYLLMNCKVEYMAHCRRVCMTACSLAVMTPEECRLSCNSSRF